MFADNGKTNLTLLFQPTADRCDWRARHIEEAREMKILCEDAFWKVSVTWSRPMVYENLIKNGSIHDDEAHLYMISGKYAHNASKVFYVGKTYRQLVSDRLTQIDHKKRYAYLREEYPRHKLYVSHGMVEIDGGKRTAKKNRRNRKHTNICNADRPLH